jgi:WD40 repeat protein
MTGTARRLIFPAGIEYQHYTMFTSSINAMLPILKHNIYGLKDPGSNIDTISPPEPDLLAPIAYCCVYWVEHLFQACESGASRKKIFLKDGGILHSFLKAKYLCWLESLALLRSLTPQGTDAVQKLKNLLCGYYKGNVGGHHDIKMANPRGEKGANRFGLITHNAYQLIQRYKNSSLRTYIDYAYTFFYHYDDSHLRAFINDAYQFFQNCQNCVLQYPLQLYHSAIIFEDTHSAIYTTFQHIIRAEFNNNLTCIKMPQRRFSLVQNIKLNCRGHIITLLYSPDSSYLCAVSAGGTVSLCRTDTCSLERVIELDIDKEDNRMFSLRRKRYFIAFSINSKRLVSISRRGIVQIWAVGCGTQLRKFSLDLNATLLLGPETLYLRIKPLQEEVIALSKDGNLAASICRTPSGAASSVKIWTLEAGNCLHVIDQSHMPDIFHATFSSNSAMIALTNGKDARIYSVQTGKEIKHIIHPRTFSDFFSGNMIYSRFSPDSKLLALKYTDRDMCLWSTETWTLIRHIKSKLSAGHFDLSLNAAMSVLSHSDALLIESMDTGEPLLNIKSHIPINNPVFSPDWVESSLLASFSDGAVQIWRAYINKSDSMKSSGVQNTSNSTMHTTISPKSKFVTACDDRGNIEIWSGKNGECTQVLQSAASTWSLPVFSPNLELMFCVQGEEGNIQVWHVETGKLLHLLEGPGAQSLVIGMAVSDNSAYVVVGYWAGVVKVWCVKSGKWLFERSWYDGDMIISEVAFSPDSKYIALVSDGVPMVACIFDWRKGHCISQFEVGNGTFLRSLAFSSNAAVLVTICSRRPLSSPDSYEVKFYDIASGTCLGRVSISESNCLPLFDSAKDHLVSHSFRFLRKQWYAIPQPGYSFLETGSDTITGKERWICFGEHKVFQIPRQLLEDDANAIQVTDSLLAFKNLVGELHILQLPKQYHIHRNI